MSSSVIIILLSISSYIFNTHNFTYKIKQAKKITTYINEREKKLLITSSLLAAESYCIQYNVDFYFVKFVLQVCITFYFIYMIMMNVERVCLYEKIINDIHMIQNKFLIITNNIKISLVECMYVLCV